MKPNDMLQEMRELDGKGYLTYAKTLARTGRKYYRWLLWDRAKTHSSPSRLETRPYRANPELIQRFD